MNCSGTDSISEQNSRDIWRNIRKNGQPEAMVSGKAGPDTVLYTGRTGSHTPSRERKENVRNLFDLYWLFMRVTRTFLHLYRHIKTLSKIVLK